MKFVKYKSMPNMVYYTSINWDPLNDMNTHAWSHCTTITFSLMNIRKC